jgi:hypothetical protein
MPLGTPKENIREDSPHRIRFSSRTAVASILWIPNYESTVYCREIVFPLLLKSTTG